MLPTNNALCHHETLKHKTLNGFHISYLFSLHLVVHK